MSPIKHKDVADRFLEALYELDQLHPYTDLDESDTEEQSDEERSKPDTSGKPPA